MQQANGCVRGHHVSAFFSSSRESFRQLEGYDKELLICQNKQLTIARIKMRGKQFFSLEIICQLSALSRRPSIITARRTAPAESLGLLLREAHHLEETYFVHNAS